MRQSGHQQFNLPGIAITQIHLRLFRFKCAGNSNLIIRLQPATRYDLPLSRTCFYTALIKILKIRVSITPGKVKHHPVGFNRMTGAKQCLQFAWAEKIPLKQSIGMFERDQRRNAAGDLIRGQFRALPANCRSPIFSSVVNDETSTVRPDVYSVINVADCSKAANHPGSLT